MRRLVEHEECDHEPVGDLPVEERVDDPVQHLLLLYLRARSWLPAPLTEGKPKARGGEAGSLSHMHVSTCMWVKSASLPTNPTPAVPVGCPNPTRPANRLDDHCRWAGVRAGMWCTPFHF